MEYKIVEVTSIKAQTYGYRDEYRISFHNESGPVRFPKSWSEKHGLFHLDNEDIEYLLEKYPDYIPRKDDPYYCNYVVDWGYDLEEGLYKLMKENKLIFDRKERDSLFYVSFKWVGEKWDPEKNRKIKRKMPKR